MNIIFLNLQLSQKKKKRCWTMASMIYIQLHFVPLLKNSNLLIKYKNSFDQKKFKNSSNEIEKSIKKDIQIQVIHISEIVLHNVLELRKYKR